MKTASSRFHARIFARSPAHQRWHEPDMMLACYMHTDDNYGRIIIEIASAIFCRLTCDRRSHWGF